MAIVNKFTAVLPNPTETHVDGFIFQLTTQWFIDAANAVDAVGSPIDGGAKSLANGGGDMQAFADAATTEQLPLHVVEFVTGGSPIAQIWVRRASWTAGDTITIAKDDTQTVQPLPSSAYGQYNVYQGRQLQASLDNPLTDTVDNTGTKSLTVTPSVSAVDGIVGSALAVSSGNIRTVSAFTSSSTARYSKWIRIDSAVTNCFITDLRGGDVHILSVIYWNGSLQIYDGSFRVNLGALTTGKWYKLDVAQNGNDVDVYLDGAYSATIVNMLVDPSSAVSYTVGAAYTDTAPFNFGSIDEDFIDSTGSNAAKIADEYANQSDPDNFATIGAWVDVGAGGLDITVPLIEGTTEVYNPTVTTAQFIDLPIVLNVVDVYQPTVQLGGQFVDVDLVSNETEVLELIVLQELQLELSLVTGETFVYKPMLTGGEPVVVVSNFIAPLVSTLIKPLTSRVSA